jgi:glucose-6-phosphate 1-dehydrogenase
MAETLGVEGRGVFYEEVGAIRDVVQNHMLEIVALLTMEAPIGHDADAMRDAKQRAFRAMRPLAPTDVVRGQFRGYHNENGVASDSKVETFAAIRLHIDTCRWAGVPFYIRAGKRMPISATEVLVELKRPPRDVFDIVSQSQANYFRFRLSPNVTISLGARAKMPGEAMVGERVELVVDPILGNVIPVHEYEPNTWGPTEADQIIAGDGGWCNPQPAVDKVPRTTKRKPGVKR